MMALPVVKSIIHCSDFNKTVLPFVPQLYELPHKLFESYSDLESLRAIYLATNPLITALAFALFLSPICLIVSEVNKNYSQVDRLWSILPALYNAHYCAYAHLSGLPTARLDNLLACSVVWSLRLTFNYWRKGGYSIGSEDYRWSVTANFQVMDCQLTFIQGCSPRKDQPDSVLHLQCGLHISRPKHSAISHHHSYIHSPFGRRTRFSHFKSR